MLLTGAAQERVRALGFDYEAQPKEPVATCNLCGGVGFVVLTHSDRYAFSSPTQACLTCGLAFLNPRMNSEAYQAFYEDVYRPLVSAYHGRLIDPETVELEQEGYAAALAELLAPFLADRAGGALLDVGGSTGLVAAELAGRFELRATVLDPAPAEIERARARGLEATVSTLDAFQPGGRRFDVVLMCQTIDHLPDVSGALARTRGLLAPDGLLFVDIVDFRAAYLRGWSVEAATKVDHPTSLTEATALALLTRAGFRVLRTDYAADHLHVGYVCSPTEPEPALPPPATVERLLAEVRLVQNAPRPG